MQGRQFAEPRCSKRVYLGEKTEVFNTVQWKSEYLTGIAKRAKPNASVRMMN